MSNKQYIKKYNDLIFDVGMHRGEDTAYYLKRGFRVIGFEADPDLVMHCKAKFAEEIKASQLHIVDGAITDMPAGETMGTTVKFYKNINNSVWGTISSEWADRNATLGTSSEIIDVPVISFSQCIEEYGIPYYLKIDIEGMDTVCLKTLLTFTLKPSYVSIESEKVHFKKLKVEFALLRRLGYDRFKAIQQEGISKQLVPFDTKVGPYVDYHFQEGSSGLFGEELPGEWKNYRNIINEYRGIFLLYKLFGDYGILKDFKAGHTIQNVLSKRLQRPVPGWYDTHAKHMSSEG
ncbi:MAG TPA: FkbM family methyltransferase [Bacteroidales bacterium]|nr:FkbM family methyltransferase [Bacteroidales bacterium]